MTKTSFWRSASLSAMALAALAATPAKAEQDFFQMLFGGGRPEPRYYAPEPAYQPPRFMTVRSYRARHVRIAAKAHDRPHRVHVRLADVLRHAPKHEAAPLAYAAAPERAPGKPPEVCCASASDAIAMVSHDTTLRPGDAFMTPDGLSVFVGTRDDDHGKKDFVSVTKAHSVAASHRARLAAMVAAPVRKTVSPAKPAAEREPTKSALPNTTAAKSAAAVPAAEQASFIVDPTGRKIRFVGGYYPGKL